MNLIILGAPGAGKGTQAEFVCEQFKLPAISTGNMLREAIKKQTPLGESVKQYLDDGALVPDRLMIEVIQQRIAQDDCKNGFVLDGFPRTMSQAKVLDQMGVLIDLVLNLEVSDQIIMQRLSGRRVCEVCGSSYHLEYKPSMVEGVCDKCQGRVVRRQDDHPDTVQERLSIYHRLTEPLKDYYQAAGKLCTIMGQEKVLDTTELTLQLLKDFYQPSS